MSRWKRVPTLVKPGDEQMEQGPDPFEAAAYPDGRGFRPFVGAVAQDVTTG